MIFDSHAHYDDEQFDIDRESLLGSLLPTKDVVGILNCSSSYESIPKTIKLCDDYDFIHGAVGVHPENAKDLPTDYLEKVENFAKHKKVVAIGEIGLDYYYEEYCPRDIQQKVFQEQLELAKKLDLPVIIHDRDAHADTLEFLKKANVRGVVHCFSGSKEMAKEILKLGFYIGLGGVVTFKNARHSVEVAEMLPLDRLLLETDAPYLSPVPYRGKRNDSSYIAYTAARIAEVKSVKISDVLENSYKNVKNLFKI